MQTTPRIVMTYNCNQNWDAMTPTKYGRHCKACMTTVVDFTTMSIDEIGKHSKSIGVHCGNFSIKQLRPELIEVSSVFLPLKKYLIILFTIISSELVGSSNKQSLNNEAAIGLNINSIKSKSPKFETQNSSSKLEMKNKSKNDPLSLGLTNKKRKRLYISRKFPFIHYKKSCNYPGRYYNVP